MAQRQAKFYPPRRAAMHEIECSSSHVLRLVHCGGAASGVEAPQYKPFYTVPLKVATHSFSLVFFEAGLTNLRREKHAQVM